jgi:hypothetical protein
MLVSVISNCSQAASQPVRARVRRSSETIVPSRSWPAERFTQMVIWPMPASRHARAWRQAASSTQAPTAWPRPGLVGERDESRRQHEAALRVVPAQQRLGAAHLAGVDVHDRLVMQRKLVALQRAAQRRLDVQALGAARGELGREEAIRVPPQLLRVVHRRVGILEERLGVEPSSGCSASPRLPLTWISLPSIWKGRRTSSEDLARDALGRAVVGQLLEHDDEFVARDAREDVGLPQRPADAVRELLQQPSPDAVAERVVHVLEVVEVRGTSRPRRACRGARARARR